MTAVSDHHALAARIEAADGPSRELDAEIVVTFFNWSFKKLKGDRHPYWRKPKDAEFFYRRQEGGPPAYTSDLNAAYDLAKRLAPGLVLRTAFSENKCEVGLLGAAATCFAHTERPDQHLALAICAAAVKAAARGEEAK